MSTDDDFGDLVYVSQLKVERMHAALKPPPWKRVKSAEVKGPAGVGLGLELDSDRGNLVSKLRAVTDDIYRHYAVRYYYDPNLRPGRFFVGRMPDMAFGRAWWDHCPEDGPVVIFTGSDDDRLTDVVLGGSLQHMLDRDLPLAKARTGSTTERFREVMSKSIAVEEEGRKPASVPPVQPAGVSNQSLEEIARASAACIHGFLVDDGGRNSLIFMARAIDVFEAREGHTPRRLITGTPLYVGIWEQEEESEVTVGEPEARPSMLGRLGARFSYDMPEPVTELPAPAHPPISVASDDDAPSLDIALYVRPGSDASYASAADYYDASPRVERGRPDVAAGEIDHFSREHHWFDEQGGRWHVSFSTYGGAHFDVSPNVVGEVVATSVGPDGTGEVLVLLADVRLGDVENALVGRSEVAPRLKWLVDHLPHHAIGSDEPPQ